MEFRTPDDQGAFVAGDGPLVSCAQTVDCDNVYVFAVYQRGLDCNVDSRDTYACQANERAPRERANRTSLLHTRNPVPI